MQASAQIWRNDHKRRIGIMGGTFDPIHIAHLMLAEQSYQALQLDGVWWIPTRQSPHKTEQPQASADDRVEMVAAAISEVPYFELKDLERDGEGSAFTIDTVTRLQEMEQETQFYFLLGADQVRALPSWHRVDDLMQRIWFVCTARPGFVDEQLETEIQTWPAHWQERLIWIDMPQLDISATMIRARCAAGLSIRYWVHDAVRKLIGEKGLYDKRVSGTN